MSELRQIAALYIDPRGPYPRMAGVDCWDESRDARLYDGPHPVVAHPPCGPWGAMRHLKNATLAGKDCGPLAIEAVQRWGGVVEQPAWSSLFAACGVPSCTMVKVEQVAWGHACRKPTWLYFRHVPLELVLSSLRLGGEPTHQIYGSRNTENAKKHGDRADLLAASSQIRRRTPQAFAEWLVGLARASELRQTGAA